MTEIKISASEYATMRRQLAKLTALENGGVDNWEHYGEALTEWRKEGQVDEAYDDAMNAINDLMSEAEVDYPAGREAGSRITFDEDGMRKILASLVAQILDVR